MQTRFKILGIGLFVGTWLVPHSGDVIQHGNAAERLGSEWTIHRHWWQRSPGLQLERGCSLCPWGPPRDDRLIPRGSGSSAALRLASFNNKTEDVVL